MTAYLESQIPHLRSLHSSLGLADHELANDLRIIEEAVKAAVDGKIAVRREAVQELGREIERVERRIGKLRRVLEDEEVDVGGNEGVSLPSRLGALKSQESRLQNVYDERCAKIRTLIETLSSILSILGKTYSLPPELASIVAINTPSSSTTTISPPPYTPKSGEIDVSRGTRISGEQEEVKLENASLRRIRAIEEGIRVAHLEKVKRADELHDLFEDLRFLHGELLLPTFDANSETSTLCLPKSDAPPEETRQHLSSLQNYFSTPLPLTSSEDPVRPLSAEPTPPLLTFSKLLQTHWLSEKSSREQRIQTLFDEIEPIWLRLQVPQEDIQGFIEENCGLSGETIQAYEGELERVRVLRKESLGAVIQAVREEIQGLWGKLLYGPMTIAAFEPFQYDMPSEEVLELHELEAERLESELAAKKSLLGKAQEWVDLQAKEEELEARKNAPDRFNTRGGALLQEEKMRKRVAILKPKLEADLLANVPIWEEEHGMEFLVDDVRIVDIIITDRETKEAEKEAKRRAKSGYSGSGITPARSYAPPSRSNLGMSTGRTPAPAASGTRKREAPTPTPAGYGNGRTRVINPLASSTSSNTSQSYGYATPAPPPAYSLPRPVPMGMARVHTIPSTQPLGASASHIAAGGRNATYNGSMIPKVNSSIPVLGRDGMRRPRRESFRPRMSVVYKPGRVGSGLGGLGGIADEL